MPPGVAELLADGGPYALTRERLFAEYGAEYGLDWDLGSPPDEGREVPAGLGGTR
jgi:hypothetical protein